MMRSMGRLPLLLLLLTVAFALAGCGGSSNKAAPPATTTTTTAATSTAGTTTTTSGGTTTGPGALKGEAQQAATGDIPDNQVFLTFSNAAAGYSMKYPEGWAQQGSGNEVTFRDKNNIVRIVVSSGGPFTSAAVKADAAALKGATVTSGPAAVTISGQPALKVVYTTESAPNAVTGKRVKLVVDRYYLWHGTKRAIIELGTPEGVDNVDAYRLMIESFKWH
jgi:hypothetical protein